MTSVRHLALVVLALLSMALPARMPALFWGDFHGGWKSALADFTQGISVEGDTPPLPVYPDTRIAVWCHVCNYQGKKFGPQEVKKLVSYIRRGGILIMSSSVPTALFSDKNVFDISTGAPVLGVLNYRYGHPASKPTDTAREILGELADKGNIYSSCNWNHPAVGNFCGMKVLFGSKQQADIGVHRIGKGALLYTACGYQWGFPCKADAPYARMLNKLVRTLADPALLNKFFPIPPGNDAVTVNGKKLNLLVEGKGSPASFLREKLLAITGLEALNPSYAHPQFIIHVGETEYAKSLKLELNKLHPAGYVMVCRDGRNLVLAGQNSWGTTYAVNDFLKRFAGYRRFGALPMMEVIPKRPTLVLPAKLDIREEPDVNSYVLAWGGNSSFGRNSRCNSLATHSLDQVVPPKRFAKTHPEYYPMINGKRLKIVPGQIAPWNPCLANPDLPKLIAEYSDRYFKAHPEKLSLPMGVNDGGGDCQCPKCLEVFHRTGNQYVEFYNMAARIVAKRHPGKLVAFITYTKTAKKAPKGVTMEPNVLAEIIGHDQKNLEAWRKAGVKHFGIYDYNYATGGSKIVPQFYPHILGNLWKKYHREYKLTSIWMEYYPQIEIMDAPRQYVLDELAWNMDADIDALLDDYYQSMFNQAAPEIKDFYTRLETCYARTVEPPTKDKNEENSYFGLNRDNLAFTRGDLFYLQRQLDKAMAGDHEPIVKARLNALNKIFRVVRLHALNSICAMELKGATNIKSLEECRTLVNVAGEAFEAQRQLKNLTLTPDEQKQILIKGKIEDLISTTIAPAPILEAALDPAFQRIADYLTKHGYDVNTFFSRAAQEAVLPDHQAAIRTQLYIRQNTLKNLVRNPSFEEVGKDFEKKLLSDHISLRGVPFWSTWTFPSCVTKFNVTEKEAHSGKRAGIIRENQYQGTLISYVSLKPNCRYRLSLWVKRNAGNVAFRGCGNATVRMQRHGSFIDSGSAIKVHFTPECENKWVRYETTFTAPDKDAVTALILLGAAQQTPDIWTAYDDVALEIIYDPKAKFKEKEPKIHIEAPQAQNLPQLKTALENTKTFIALAGQNVPSLNIKLILQDKGPDGAFDLQGNGQNVTITGNEEGLRCGLYTLLNHLGFHWFSPEEDMIFPQKPTKPDFTRLNGHHKPDFPYRGLHICDCINQFDETVARWMSFNRMNRKLTHLPSIKYVSQGLQKLGIRPDTTVHAYSEFIREDKYFKTHPEYFALIGGKRTPYSKGGQLCLANQNMRNDFTKELLKTIDKHRNLGVIGICPEDGYGHCECPKCMALDTPEDRKNKRTNGRIASFVQDICARVKKAEPDFMLGHYSYSNFADFIKLIPNPPDNLLISFTQFHCHNHPIATPSCPTNSTLQKRFEHICSKVKHLYIYDYYSYCWGNLPAPYWAAQYKDFNYWKKLGVDGFLTEVGPYHESDWQSFWPAIYYAARLLWNSDYPTDQFIPELCRIRYGKAAQPMERYFNALLNSMESMKACFTKAPENLAQLLTPDTLKACDQALKDAMQITPDARLVQKERKLFDSWCQNLKERTRFKSDMHITARTIEAKGFKPQNIHLVSRSNQLADLENNTFVEVAADDKIIRVRLKMMEKNMHKLQCNDKSVYSGDNIELFFDDGKNPKMCYHFLINPNGKAAVSSCLGPIWNWNWKHNAIIKGQKLADQWTLDFTIPKSDINAGKTFGFNVVRNLYTRKIWSIYGAPDGGAFFNVKKYIQVTTPEN